MDKASEYTNSNWLFCLLSLFKDVYYTLKVDCLFAYFLSPNMFTTHSNWIVCLLSQYKQNVLVFTVTVGYFSKLL